MLHKDGHPNQFHLCLQGQCSPSELMFEETSLCCCKTPPTNCTRSLPGLDRLLTGSDTDKQEADLKYLPLFHPKEAVQSLNLYYSVALSSTVYFLF